MEYYKEESVAFNSYNEHYILSNMYHCDLIYKGAIFYGVDHLYHFLLFYRNKEVQEKIMKKCKGINANFQAKKISEENKDKIADIKPMQNLKRKIAVINEAIKRFKLEDKLNEITYIGDEIDDKTACKIVGINFKYSEFNK